MVRPLPQITHGPPHEPHEPEVPQGPQGPQAPAGPKERKERADAARNRAKVLEAADRLFARRGLAEVTMDDVASEARVGKGTLYRRFGDKSGLAAALLDDRETELQRQILTGPPPLGPGADPHERLAAFIGNYLDYVAKHLDLVKMSQTASPGARLRTGSHQLWRHHCRILLTEAHADDPEIRADILMAAMTAEQVEYWLAVGKPIHQIRRALIRLAREA